MRNFIVRLSLIVQCSWCGKPMGGDGKPPVTHGIWGPCLEKASK